MPKAKLKNSELKEKEIVILYIEDHPGFYEAAFAFIRQQWSPKSRHVRSLDRGADLIESEGFKPDFAIHDCKILLYEDVNGVPQEESGDRLYVALKEQHIPVVVMTGQPIEQVSTKLPYSTDPPELGYISKPTSHDNLKEAVRRYVEEFVPSRETTHPDA